jgi:transcription initiation factor IIE alpha subunit
VSYSDDCVAVLRYLIDAPPSTSDEIANALKLPQWLVNNILTEFRLSKQVGMSAERRPKQGKVNLFFLTPSRAA